MLPSPAGCLRRIRSGARMEVDDTLAHGALRVSFHECKVFRKITQVLLYDSTGMGGGAGAAAASPERATARGGSMAAAERVRVRDAHALGEPFISHLFGFRKSDFVASLCVPPYGQPVREWPSWQTAVEHTSQAGGVAALLR